MFIACKVFSIYFSFFSTSVVDKHGKKFCSPIIFITQCINTTAHFFICDLIVVPRCCCLLPLHLKPFCFFQWNPLAVSLRQRMFYSSEVFFFQNGASFVHTSNRWTPYYNVGVPMEVVLCCFCLDFCCCPSLLSSPTLTPLFLLIGQVLSPRY